MFYLRNIRKVGVLAVRREVRATRLPRYAKWLQLERRLVSEVVGVGCEIHITQMYHLTCCMGFVVGFVEEIGFLCVRRGVSSIDEGRDRWRTLGIQGIGVSRRISVSDLYRANNDGVVIVKMITWGLRCVVLMKRRCVCEWKRRKKKELTILGA